MDLSIVVPCYNEANGIPKIQRELLPVVAELAQTRYVEVILVDDGSRDGTWEALHTILGQAGHGRLTIRFERHERNRGLGAALRTGFAAAQGAVVVTTDSDGTYRFTEIPALLERLTADVDIVTASPYHPQGGVAGVPRWRLVFSRGSSLIYRILVDPGIHTYTALFRAYRREVIEQVTFEANGFLGQTELMVKAMLAGFRVAEYPAVLHSRVLGVSKAKLVRTVRAHLGFQSRVLLHRLRLVPLTSVTSSRNRQ